MDFCQIKTRPGSKKGMIEVYPDFKVMRSKDLMIRGKSFYAVWDDDQKRWTTDEYEVQRLVDMELDQKRMELEQTLGAETTIKVRYTSSFSSRSWSEFKSFLSNMPDNSHQLDSKLTFANTQTKKTDYVSKRLPYPLSEGDYSAWDELVSTLYDPDERAKIEWAIGAIVAGDAKDIQKFLVFYGDPGSGKGTIMNVISKLFEGYYTTFDAKALTTNGNQFAMEVFKTNPLVAIQQDGDLSRIEDNTRLNSIVSHEEMPINEKYKSTYTARVNCFPFMGTNKPVKITDGKSGIIRRLIDVHPSGRLLPPDRYFDLMGRINMQLGAIAWHCLEVYKALGKNHYAKYRPLDMIYKTDVFFNFVEDSYATFASQNSTTLKAAYAMYKQYCDDSGAEFKLPMYKFREELKNYFENFSDMVRIDGKQVRSYYSGFMDWKFNRNGVAEKKDAGKGIDLLITVSSWNVLRLDISSEFDMACGACPAQYATKDETPIQKWANVKALLRDLDTRKLHYVKPPENMIVVDFDLKDETGNKSLALNVAAAEKWPPTYAEVSKGGQGLHLHYIYDGDPKELATVYGPDIEIKTFTGGSSLRRKLTLCNSQPIRKFTGDLPKKEAKVINEKAVKSEKALRKLLQDCLDKKHHGATKPEVDFIESILNDAYKSGMKFDVTDFRPRVMAFANNSSHQAEACVKKVAKMVWKSDEPSENVEAPNDIPITFFDVEVFPNLLLVVLKEEGEGKPCHRFINPSTTDIELILQKRLVGFNCRRYDNHILYARYLGWDNMQIYDLSQRIIAERKNCLFGEAYNISYTDVYDFCSKKQSLKKWEIELGIHHQELGLPWDQTVPVQMFDTVADYCENDVRATEAVWNARQADWTARKILADVAGLTVNDTTNTLTTKIIFGSNRKPQEQFNYRDMGAESDNDIHIGEYRDGTKLDADFTVFRDNRPIFPGYRFENGKSLYRGEEVGEGGYVYAEPGVYHNIALLDIASMHPSSIVAEELFGPEYTKRFSQILGSRIAIKHKDFDHARKMLDGKLAPYLNDENQAKDLAQALKIAINSVYGLTSAKFDNPFRDPRNKDNIVAKRGALFMVNLKHEVQNRGFTVAHIKTDSIKIPNATPEIIQFVMDYGSMYGYTFEHEATYDRMCLVNDAVYIAKYKDGDWTATGAQFQHPYVFKRLFTHEPIVFNDYCEAKSVTSALYLDFNENLPEDEHKYKFVGKAGYFCPVKKGTGGGLLVREKDGKYYAATGTKGYRWKEAEIVESLGLQDDVDTNYAESLADAAVSAIAELDDYEAFVNVDKEED